MNSPQSLNIRTELLPLSVAYSLWKNRTLVIATTALLSVASVLVIRNLPSVYRAEAVVLVAQPKIPERLAASTVNSPIDDRLNTLTREIKNGDRLRDIIKDFDLYHELNVRSPDAIVAKIRSDMEITFDRGWTNERTGAFRVAYKGPSPKTVAAVANRLANLFIEENSRVREGQAEGASEFIEMHLRDAKTALDQLESAVGRYKQQHNGELPDQANALNAALARLEGSLQGNRDAINRAAQNKAVLVETLRSAELEEALLARPPRKPREAAAPNDVAPPEPRRKSDVLAAQLETLQQRYSEEHPDIRRARAELARAREAEKAEADLPKASAPAANASRSSGVTDDDSAGNPTVDLVRARERTAQLKLQLSMLDEEAHTRSAEREKTLAEIDAYRKRIESLPIREQELSRLTRDLEISRANYTSLLSKKLSAEIGKQMEKDMQSESFTIFEAAKPPTAPFQPNRPLLTVVACVASLVIGVVFAIGRELKRSVLLGEWELVKTTPILGRVPRIERLPALAEDGGRGSGRVPALASIVLAILGILAAGFYFSGRHSF